MKMPFGRHKDQEVADCPLGYLAWLLTSRVRIGRGLREAVELALAPEVGECLGRRWWHLQRACRRQGHDLPPL
jgi:hypothetical protein